MFHKATLEAAADCRNGAPKAEPFQHGQSYKIVIILCHEQKHFKQNIFISQVLLECGTIRRGEEQATVCRFPLRGDPKEMRTTRMGATRRVIAVCHGSGLRIAVVRWAGDGGHQGSNLNYVRRTSRVIYPTSSVPESQGKPSFHTKYPQCVGTKWKPP